MFLYNTIIAFYGLAIRAASLFNKKAKSWIEGRKNWEHELASSIDYQKEIIWFHCASLGEFEQGRPVIEKTRTAKPNAFILLTFFSPSGYEIRKDYSMVNYVCYLPLDTKKNASTFINISKPCIAIFVKYEFWFNMLDELHQQKIRTYFISVNIRRNHFLLSGPGKFLLNSLKRVNHLFLQNNNSFEALSVKGFKNISISGDTRFDRVVELSSKDFHDEILDRFKGNFEILIAGSTWSHDEEILANIWDRIGKENIKLIIAPHEISQGHLEQIQSKFKKFKVALYTKVDVEKIFDIDVLIIDCIGKLMSMYAYGNYAYVGGGFGKGIHNTLEPACFGLPIYFGPNYQKFNEAIAMIQLGTAFSFEKEEDFRNKILEHHHHKSELELIKKLNIEFVTQQSGATKKIIEHLNLG